jgi:two-component system phosphate regulon sensor histidine kinase PhoR
LETLLNSMQDAVIAVDRVGRVQWANGAMRRALGDVVRIGANLVATVRDPALLAAIQDSLTLREERRTKLSLLPGRAFEATTAPMPGGGAVAVLHDISEIERVEKTRRDFIANVSHELKTPLTSIQGYTETLLDATGADAGTREFLDIIRRNAALMSRLTEDLLTLARVESGEDKLEKDVISARELLDDALRNLQELTRSSGMELTVEASSNRPVVADRDAIEQVFANLIHNATRYARSGQRIVIGSRDLENEVEFFVRDFGPGIASEHLPRLFERFYRVDKARSRESGGTGLGLAIVKHIIINHGGSVRAESELGHGSTFAFTLPLATTAIAAEHAH